MSEEEKLLIQEGGDPLSPPEAEKPKRLSFKRRAFVEAYLETWNATEAARRAGYAHPNKQGPRLLVNVGIQAEITRRLEESAMKSAEVLARLAEQARGDLGDYFKTYEKWTEYPHDSERILDSEEFEKIVDNVPVKAVRYYVRKVAIDIDALVDPSRSRIIRKFSDNPKTGLSIELYDAQAADSLIGKHLKLFTEAHEIDLSDRLNSKVERLVNMAEKVYGNSDPD